jgi:hypothetical protein
VVVESDEHQDAQAPQDRVLSESLGEDLRRRQVVVEG